MRSISWLPGVSPRPSPHRFPSQSSCSPEFCWGGCGEASLPSSGEEGVLGRFSDSYCEIPSYSGPVGGEDWPFCLFCFPAASLMNRFPSRFSAVTLLSQCYCTQASWWAGLVFRVTESSGLIGVKCHKKGRNKVRRSPGNRGRGGGGGLGERRRDSPYCMTGGPVQVSAKRAGHSQELECKVSCSKTLRTEKTPSCSSDSCADFCRGSEGLKWARPTCSAPLPSKGHHGCRSGCSASCSACRERSQNFGAALDTVGL